MPANRMYCPVGHMERSWVMSLLELMGTDTLHKPPAVRSVSLFPGPKNGLRSRKSSAVVDVSSAGKAHPEQEFVS